MLHLHNDAEPHNDETENALLMIIDERTTHEEEALVEGELDVEHPEDRHPHIHPTLPPPLPREDVLHKVVLDPVLMDGMEHQAADRAHQSNMIGFEVAVDAEGGAFIASKPLADLGLRSR